MDIILTIITCLIILYFIFLDVDNKLLIRIFNVILAILSSVVVIGTIFLIYAFWHGVLK